MARNPQDIDALADRAAEAARRSDYARGLLDAAHIAVNACLVYPDGGNPTEAERLVCEEAYRRILSMIPEGV